MLGKSQVFRMVSHSCKMAKREFKFSPSTCTILPAFHNLPDPRSGVSDTLRFSGIKGPESTFRDVPPASERTAILPLPFRKSAFVTPAPDSSLTKFLTSIALCSVFLFPARHREDVHHPRPRKPERKAEDCREWGCLGRVPSGSAPVQHVWRRSGSHDRRGKGQGASL